MRAAIYKHTACDFVTYKINLTFEHDPLGEQHESTECENRVPVDRFGSQFRHKRTP